ncbi:mismatch repair ATPase (MutS family) [Prevotella dentalis DSM 3688]|uniref:DNA mismatch repair protein mutS n=1 Tax=Prevotella dentalis (strain ATCC 49559 / DSM 3688 / JCM 13448 / NCTC 12043 / ES 2772) TaxID=908937 RepID=F9D6Z5_PREDD|nr:DNA mismatch repair protein MutS [Prevotella dentalis]AGB29693.1 mismatch repair ATPase (MutS family) [Prevotella dentalis DSM 3688]EGQ11864.1 DNA mismatch repair protein mutS [Prevotella dentalis DSM 3688]
MDRKKYKNLDYDYIVSSVAGYAKVAPIARKVKAGDEMAIARAATMMVAAVRNVMPMDRPVVLVPIPNRTGRAGYTKTLAEKISEALHLPVIDALASNTHEPLYLVKKANGSLDEVPLYFYRIRRVPKDKIPILIDNVLDTGHTAMAAYEALGRQDTRMAVLGDTHKFTPNKWKPDIYPLIDNNMARKKKEEVPQQATPKEEPTAQTEKKAAKKTSKLPKSKTLAELYTNMKEKHPDAVLLFRTGDFYTAVNADASKVADTLAIKTTKPTKAEDGSLQVTFPHHALDTNLPKLIRAGLRVAIVDSLEKKQSVEKSASVETESKAQEKKEEGKAVDKSTTTKQDHQPREPQMITVNGDKVSHAHAFQSKVNPADWFYVAQINGKQLNPMKMDAADIAAYQKREAKVEDMMQKYYPTKLAPKVSVEEYKAANTISDGRIIDKMTVYKEKDEQRADYGKYKLYAQVGDQRMSVPMTKADQSAFFDRVTTPAALVEKNFGERLHLASAYSAYQLPANIKVEDIRVAKDNMDGKWKISAAVGENGRTEKKAISFDDGFSLFQAKTVTREQLAAKYLSDDIKVLSGQKQTISNGLKM